jgi:hypothetical protein
MAEPKLPLPIFTDPLYRTGGLGGAAMLPVPVTIPAGSGQTFSKVATTGQKQNKDYHVSMGNPLFIDFAGIINSPDVARLGRGMLEFGEYKAKDWMDNIPTNLAANATKGQLNPFNTTSFFALGSEAVKAAIGGKMTGNLVSGLVGKAGGSILASTAVGAMIQPSPIAAMSDMSSEAFREWAEAHRQKNLEHEVKVKSIDEEYGKKMKGKYAGIEMLMETPMWKRDTSPQFTQEERKLQNYEEIIIQRGQKLEAASRQRASLENGFYNDKGDFMSAHFARNSK